jgi:hypothetical protein
MAGSEAWAAMKASFAPGARHEIAVEDVGRQPERGTGVGYVDHAGDVPLDRRRAEDRVGLSPGIAELLKMLDRVEAGLPVGDMHVEIVLLALFVDGDALQPAISMALQKVISPSPWLKCRSPMLRPAPST